MITTLLFAASLLRLPDATGTPAQLTLNLGRGMRVVERSADGPATYDIEVAGKRVGGWTGDSFDASHVLQGWRNGDAVLVASRVGSSNGMGVESWTFAAFRLKGKQAIASPVRWHARDWGPDGVRARPGGLDVLATDWAWATGAGPIRFAGAWFRVEDTVLTPIGSWRVRPYTFSFEKQRTHAPSFKPWSWLATHAVLMGPRDPWLMPAKPGPFQRITTVQPAADGLSLAVTFAKAGAHRADVVSEGTRVWPEGYIPSDGGRRWAGRQGALAGNGERRMLLLKR